MKFINWLGATILVVAVGMAAQQMAMAYTSNTPQMLVPSPAVNPTPLTPKHPYKVTLSGSASACQHLQSKGLRVELDCTVDCAWDAAQALPDGGFQIPYVDGGFGITAETADGNQLPASTPRVAALPPSLDSICIYSSSAGTAYVSETY